MNRRRRPPPGTTPTEFFSRWLPAEIQRLGNPKGVPEVLVRIELTGDEGGSWDLKIVGGQLEVTGPDPGSTPQVWLRLTTQDWNAVMVGEAGSEELYPPAASSLDLLFIDSHWQHLLESISGTFAFQIHEFSGRTWILTAAFKVPVISEAPDTTISIDAETYGAILTRHITPAEAFFSRKITLQGDTARGMQVGLALLPKV